MEVMRINGHNFNADWARRVSERVFVDALFPEPFWKDKLDKEADLRKAWRLMNGKPEEEIERVTDTPTPPANKKQTPRKREVKGEGAE